MRILKSLLFIMFAAVATVQAQQTIPPFATPYGNFTTGIKLGGTYGTSGWCALSTGTGTHFAACPTGITQLTGDVTAGPGSGSLPATLATVNGSPGTCGDSTHVCQITTNGKGLTTSQTQVSLTGGITQLTGDGTAGPGTGSQALTFATVNGSPGTCGDATHVCQVTTNGKGLTTAQTQVAITAGINQLTGDVTAGPGSGSQAVTFATVNGSPGTCGDATHVCQVTTNGKGLTTSQSALGIVIPATQNDVSGSRSINTAYTVGSVPTLVEVTLTSLAASECTGAGWYITAQAGADSGSMINVASNSVTNDCLGTAGVTFLVPAGWTYEITWTTVPHRTTPSSVTTFAWIELPL